MAVALSGVSRILSEVTALGKKSLSKTAISDVSCVHNMIGVVNRVSTFFFAHPKRQRKLEEVISETQPSSSVHKLKDLCRTRWVERIDALERFKLLHSSIVSCFVTISLEGSILWTSDTLTDSSTLLLALTTSDFISALVIANKSLNYLHSHH